MAARTLELGTEGEDVRSWELFLRGQGYYWVEVDGRFDPEVEEATRSWQRSVHIDDDGRVGPGTRKAALGAGWAPEGAPASETPPTASWEPPAAPFGPLSYQERLKAFGTFSYEPKPTPHNPEAIVIRGSWARDNLVSVTIPQLAKLVGGSVMLHKRAAEPFGHFFEKAEAAGLLDRVISFDGGWAPRFVRGSRTYLSNHAWGTAIDINALWNGLGCRPAPIGTRGTLVELVPLAHECGLYWGGHFKRRDPMHFELAVVK